ncbi:coproporphyrinogen III oxidase [Trichophyton tonsurans CBS 112818]|uniref:coproporphyrinogen oxidase n=2 Tax=Trichophyton TaxID=5550 RepID=F2PZJ6_TRIEC|nr:coproporphyrinogen III oxidase [Trichophyton tonsurans CBS 112818]EGE07314.1 coproporphyrinogen III oxidase [Trichophyton equinum CBS 127.97]
MATRITSIFPRALRRMPLAQCQFLQNTRRQAHTIAGRNVGSSRKALPFIGFATALTALSLYSTTSTTPISLEAPTIAKLDEKTRRETEITSSSPMRLRMEKLIKEQQKRIIDELSKIDGNAFTIDEWDRPNGGGGISCVLQDGNVFEKAGVNVSVVYGKLPRPAIEKMRADHKSFVSADVDSLDFFAAGLSLVLHPKNPMAPTVHLNYRFFETSDPKDVLNGKTNWWFGGGTDLTPSYLFPEDCEHFHKTIKDVCDMHDPSYYPKFKTWCDKYFYLTHRNEARGIGGIFFDDLDTEFIRQSSPDSASISDKEAQERLFSFVTDGLCSFLPAYVPIVKKRKDMPFTEQEKDWQQLRRGRYVEFNLVHDRGTSFGLRTPGSRIESILMSLPRTAKWVYMDPVSGTRTDGVESEDVEGMEREKELMEVLKHPREWV